MFEGKVKVVPVVFLIEHHATKAYLGSGGIAPRIAELPEPFWTGW
jgi:hypothetical protein